MQLIINADDAGIDIGRNQGIFEAVQKGVVTSISLIVGQAGWQDALSQIRKNSNVGVGLHFNLTAGKPIAQGLKTIVKPDGCFFNKFELWQRSVDGVIDSDEVAREFYAQLDAFKKAGLKLSHVDGHNHVHLLPCVRDGFLKAAPARSWVRLPFEHSKDSRNPLKEDAYSVYNNAEFLVPAANFLSQEAFGIWKDRFRYIDDFSGTLLTPYPTLEGFKKAVTELRGNVCELMCHPGGKPQSDAVNFSKLMERQKEFQILTSTSFKGFLNEQNIHLISYQDLN
ncbi:MAG: ChbG/HpnK family deacetylase [Candidatus Omnitrophota bacterium]